MSLVTFVAVCLVIIGGCSIMDEYGNFQLSSAVMAIVGAASLWLRSKAYDF